MEVRRAASILWQFTRALRRERPFFVHVNVDALAAGFYRDGLCALWAHWRGIPVGIHYRGLVARLQESPPNSFRRRFLRRLARAVELNLVLNEPSRAFIQAEVSGRSRVELVPNYYDDLEVPERKPEPRRPGEPLRVVFAGGLTRVKGVAEVLSAAEAVRDVELELLGRPYPETAEIVAQAPANVSVRGEVDHSEVLRIMASSHVLLFPTRHPEGFPNVVCEAMALGLAVISTRVGAIPEMIEDGRGGLLVDPTPEAVVAALRTLRDDDDRRLAMGRFNQEKSARLYVYDRVVKRLCGLYEECQPGSPAS